LLELYIALDSSSSVTLEEYKKFLGNMAESYRSNSNFKHIHVE